MIDWIVDNPLSAYGLAWVLFGLVLLLRLIVRGGLGEHILMFLDLVGESRSSSELRRVNDHLEAIRRDRSADR